MLEKLGSLSVGLLFIAGGIWAKVAPGSFMAFLYSDSSERYDELFLRFFPALAVVTGAVIAIFGVFLLASG